MSRILDFQDGFSSASEPNQGVVKASGLQSFANDAAFVTFKGSVAANCDAYYNSTDDTVRVFLAGAWQEMVDSTNAQTIGGNKTFSGDVTINGTTTTVNSTTLDVTDPNITINDGGNDASSEGSGITVERTGTDGSIVYEDALTSKFKLGALGSEVEVADVSSAQTLTTKTIDADNNTISNLAHGAEVDNPSSGVHGVTGSVVGTTDTQALTNKDIDGGTASNTSRITLPQDTTTNLDALTDKEGTIAYDTTLDTPVFNDGTSWNTLGGSGSGVGDNVIWLRFGNGHGSTNNKIRRFTTIETDTSGSNMTLTQSATLGDSITIDVAGQYLILGNDYRSGGSHSGGVSLNTTTPTTSFLSIASAEILDGMSMVDERDIKACWVGALAVNDVIRWHDDGTTATTTVRTSLMVQKL